MPLPALLSASPVGLGIEDWHRPRRADRQHLDELAVLPLEDERECLHVLAQAVELHSSLDAGQRDTAVQVGDYLRADRSAGRLDCCGCHLAHRVGLGYVGVDIGGRAAVLGDVLSHHRLTGGAGVTRIPGVRHHHPVGVSRADRRQESLALVGPGSRDEHLRVEVLLLEPVHERGDRRHVGGAEVHRLRLGRSDQVGVRQVVGHLLGEDLGGDGFDARGLQHALR